MKPLSSIVFLFFIMQFLLASCDRYDFFVFTLEWPKTRCETMKGCCYPTTGPLADDFIVSQFQPKRNHHKISPTFCDSNHKFDQNKILNLRDIMETNWPSLDCPSNNGIPIWSYIWEKHGTCTNFNQHEYFEAALNLKNKLNILKVLKDGGIEPNRKYFSSEKIESVVKQVIGHTPGLKCAYDKWKNSQLHKIQFCVNISGKSFIQCPVWVKSKSCKDKMRLPPFTSSGKEEIN